MRQNVSPQGINDVHNRPDFFIHPLHKKGKMISCLAYRDADGLSNKKGVKAMKDDRIQDDHPVRDPDESETSSETTRSGEPVDIKSFNGLFQALDGINPGRKLKLTFSENPGQGPKNLLRLHLGRSIVVTESDLARLNQFIEQGSWAPSDDRTFMVVAGELYSQSTLAVRLKMTLQSLEVL